MTDKVGNEITIGCFIAYGHNIDRSAGLRIGRVEDINTAKMHITVLGIDDDWFRKKPRLLTKRSTLMYPNRTVVLSTVPDSYMELYTKDCVASGGKHKWKETERLFGKICSVCGLKDSILD
jgi:hypothetical protein